MAVKTNARPKPDTYLKLVKQFRLVHIQDDAHFDEAEKMIHRLLREHLDEGAQQYLAILTDLVERYEDEHERHQIPDASEADVLRELMTSNRLTQQQLAAQAKISQSTISAVLRGARSLTRDQMITLGRRFNIPPAVFLRNA